jgi:hypothetical protein
MGDGMKIILIIFLSVALATGKHADIDQQAYRLACRYHGVTSGVALLPLVKREFLPYAFIVTGRRQHWHKITTYWDFVQQVNRNACPTAWQHVSTAKWLVYRYSNRINQPRNKE